MGGNEIWRPEWTFLVVRAATCDYFRRCQGLWKKGDQVLNWNSVLQYKGTWVMIRLSLISSISPLPQYRFGQTWYLRKATMKENLTAPVARFLEENSLRTLGFTEGSINQP